MARSARRAGRQPTHLGPGRRTRQLGLLALAAVAASVVLGALPARASSGDTDVEPIVECSFLDAGTGKYNTVWGYKNVTGGGKNTVTVPIGAANRFDNPGQNAGQPTEFKPGMNHNVFIVTHRGSSTWTLTTHTATAPGAACGSNPVPIADAGWSSLVTIVVFTGVVGGIVFWRARRARRA
jgi:hypothetical protein